MARLERTRVSTTISLLTLGLAGVFVPLMIPAPAEAQTFIVLHTLTGGGDGSQPVQA